MRTTSPRGEYRDASVGIEHGRGVDSSRPVKGKLSLRSGINSDPDVLRDQREAKLPLRALRSEVLALVDQVPHPHAHVITAASAEARAVGANRPEVRGIGPGTLKDDVAVAIKVCNLGGPLRATLTMNHRISRLVKGPVDR